MKYIILCGGSYPRWQAPRQLTELNGEAIVARTIRLLRENGVYDIAISSHDPVFNLFGVPVLHHENAFVDGHGQSGEWCDAFYPTDEPVCYLFGDVVFSPAAIRKIVETETDDIEFFASAPPFAPEYPKYWAEPFAFKVFNTARFQQAIEDVKRLAKAGAFNREPIAWELWNVIKHGPDGNVNRILFNSYVAINDYTCDIDSPDDVARFNVCD